MSIDRPVKIRAVGIVIKDGKILVMHRIRNGEEFYVLPGGGVEIGETVEEAVVRELLEETTLQIKIDRLLYHHIYDNGSEQFFYLCDYISGDPQLGDSEEAREMEVSNINFYKPIWYETEDLPLLLLYPIEIRDLIIDSLTTGFQNAPKEFSIKVEDLRQSL